MNPIIIEVAGRPASQGSKRGFVARNRVVMKESNSHAQRQWYNAVAQRAAGIMMGKNLLTGPIRLSIQFRFVRPKSHYRTGKYAGELKKSSPVHHIQTPDLSKLVRCTEDALTGVVWRDDAQVCEYDSITRVWTESSEGASIAVCPIH